MVGGGGSVVVTLDGTSGCSVEILGAAWWRNVGVKARDLADLETPTSGVNLSKTDSSWAKVEGQLVTVTSGINVHVSSSVGSTDH